MTEQTKQMIFNSVLDYLPENISNILSKLPKATVEDITEIRLRSERPLSLTLKGENVFLSNTGHICYLYQNGLLNVSKSDIDYTFRKMCDYSIYAYQREISSGFVTLKHGCRAGIAATAVYENGKIINFNAISSINIRIAGQYIGCANKLLDKIDGGLLIAGPPSCGKTTLLRDVVRSISLGINTNRKRVALIDSRGEIAAVKDGVAQNDVGPLTDVITNSDKTDGILIALRTLSPQIIAFDELSNVSEVHSVLSGVFGGADVITTVHAGSVTQLSKRKPAVELIKSGAVKNVVFINNIAAAPETVDVFRFKETLELC